MSISYHMGGYLYTFSLQDMFYFEIVTFSQNLSMLVLVNNFFICLF